MFDYGIAKYLNEKLNPYIPNEHTVQDNCTFVQVISELSTLKKF